MKLNIEIIDEITHYELDSNAVVIGSSPNCEIQLAYEGVGQEHIRIYKELGKYFLEDLNSGEETLLNGMIIAPGSIREFTPLFPVEVGGVLVHLVEDTEEAKPFVSVEPLAKDNRKKTLNRKKKSDPSKVIYLFIIIFITISVWSFFGLKSKRIDLDKITVSEKKILPIEVDLGLSIALKDYLSLYEQTIKSPTCSDLNCINNPKIKTALKGLIIKKINDKVSVGIEMGFLKRSIKDFFKLNAQELNMVENLVVDNYQAYFTLEEFLKNERVSPFAAFVDSHEIYQNLIYLYAYFLKNDLHSLLGEAKSLHFFTYEKMGNIYTVRDFIEMEHIDLDYLRSLSQRDEFTMKLYHNHKLTEGISKTFINRFKNSQEKFDSTLRDKFIDAALQLEIQQSLGKISCNTSAEKNLCSKLRVNGEVSPYEGVYFLENSLILGFDFDFERERLKKEYQNYEYSQLELKLANLQYMKASKSSDYRQFKQDSYVYKVNNLAYSEMNPQHFNESRLLVEFLSSKAFESIKKEGQLQRVILIAKEKSDILFGCILNLSKLSLADVRKATSLKTLLWRSSLPVMDDFFQSKCKPLKEF